MLRQSIFIFFFQFFIFYGHSAYSGDFGVTSCAILQDDGLEVFDFSYEIFYDEAGEINTQKTILIPDDFSLHMTNKQLFLIGDGLIFPFNQSRGHGIFNSLPAKFECRDIEIEPLRNKVEAELDIKDYKRAIAQNLELKDELALRKNQIDKYERLVAELDQTRDELNDLKTTHQLYLKRLLDEHANLIELIAENYIPLPSSGIDEIKSVYERKLITVLNNCWIEPEANKTEVARLGFYLNQKITDPIFDSTGFQGSRLSPQDVTVRTFYKKDEMKMSEKNLILAAERAIQNCIGGFYIPKRLFRPTISASVMTTGFIALKIGE